MVMQELVKAILPTAFANLKLTRMTDIFNAD